MPAHLSQSHTPRFLFPLRWGSVNPVLSPCQAGRYRGRWAGPVPVGGRHAGWGLSRVLPGETPGLDRPRGWSSGRTSDERHWWSPTSASTEWRRCPVAMATRDCSTRVAGGRDRLSWMLGTRLWRAEDGIRTRDPHLGKLVLFVCTVGSGPPLCRSVDPVSTPSIESLSVVERSTIAEDSKSTTLRVCASRG